MISLEKTYKTHAGVPVRLLCCDGPDPEHPVVGFVGVLLCSWTPEGKARLAGNVLDLVEVDMSGDVFINYYNNPLVVGTPCRSRLECDSMRSYGCTHIIVIKRNGDGEPTVRIEKVS